MHVLIGTLMHVLIGTLMHVLIGTLMHVLIGTLMHVLIGTVVTKGTLNLVTALYKHAFILQTCVQGFSAVHI
jgi:hypothetical protein